MLFALCMGMAMPATHAAETAQLFGLQEQKKAGFDIFPQWTDVLKRHLRELQQEQSCSGSCPLVEWQQFLSGLRNRPLPALISAVNSYANSHRYVLDIDNYGKNDYWATPRQFLTRDGDCEDFAIIKYLSLRALGVPPDMLRIVVLQDTNLRIPHAVLAVYLSSEILILDNQVSAIVPHRAIAHYVPVYSINEQNWWMHLP